MMYIAWQSLYFLEKVLLGASLLVIAACAGFTWKQNEHSARSDVVLQKPSSAQLIKWENSGTITIDVAGAVRYPQVVHLPAGSLVQNAVQKAGGLSPQADASELNLAASLTDGAQIYVRNKSDKSTFVVGKIDINHADALELQVLPQVGATMAQRIIEYRTTHGVFKSMDELDNIKGIGPKTLEKWQGLIVFH